MVIFNVESFLHLIPGLMSRQRAVGSIPSIHPGTRGIRAWPDKDGPINMYTERRRNDGIIICPNCFCTRCDKCSRLFDGGEQLFAM